MLVDVQENTSTLTLPLGLIVTTLMEAAAEDEAVKVLMYIYDTRLEGKETIGCMLFTWVGARVFMFNQVT